RTYERATASAGRSVRAKAALARALALAGRRDEARRLVAEVRASSAASGIYHPMLAASLVALGDTAAAVGWLEKAYEQRHPDLIELKVDTRYAALNREPRVQAI